MRNIKIGVWIRILCVMLTRNFVWDNEGVNFKHGKTEYSRWLDFSFYSQICVKTENEFKHEPHVYRVSMQRLDGWLLEIRIGCHKPGSVRLTLTLTYVVIWYHIGLRVTLT